MHRESVGKYRFYLLHTDGEFAEEIPVSKYLDIKDYHIQNVEDPGYSLKMDIMPFYDYMPSLRDPKTIGNGIGYLNRYMCSKLFNNPEEWNQKLFEFIKIHTYKGRQLLVNGEQIEDFDSFFDALEKILEWLDGKKAEQPYSAIAGRMSKAGFEPGWGNTVGRVRETMNILYDLLSAPTDNLLEQFISRVPMPLVSDIAIISPHGWFAQDNIIGKPDTGGQVIYILDQVKALEKHLKKEIELSGLDGVVPHIVVLTRLIPECGDTTCNQEREKIHQTDNCWILRVPFRDSDGNQVRQWISRFNIWPYLERFAREARSELLSELKDRPDLIIGNYSDGNLVATLLSDHMNVIQCTIAHALEKTKYLFSDLYWKDMEQDYNFSIQFAADVLAMNKSDFIISSTHQEITGTENSMGQYESYQFFTLPGKYQVTGGVNILAPKFNVIPPGVDEDKYFPYHEKERRINNKCRQWDERIFSEESDGVVGHLADPDKWPIFTMARLDKIKNITGLIEAYGMSDKLKENCNLIVAAGATRVEESGDEEEKSEIEKVYRLLDQYNLHDHIRWIPSNRKLDTGVVYRVVADRKGVFVQPALFEAFGLTILEAMVSGLPTFGPKFGGPLEIIEEGRSGFLMNTSKPEFISRKLEEFVDQRNRNAEFWDTISSQGIERVQKHFNWRSYSSKLINQTKLYGFWRYSVSNQAKVKMDRYCDFLYHFLIKCPAQKLVS